jgi:hypothetical protein
MATKATVDSYLFVTGLGVQRASGKVTPLDTANAHADVVGPAEVVEIPSWAPEGVQFAWKVIDRGVVFIEITAAEFPELILEFRVDVDDPNIAIIGNLVVMSAPV